MALVKHVPVFVCHGIYIRYVHTYHVHILGSSTVLRIPDGKHGCCIQPRPHVSSVIYQPTRPRYLPILWYYYYITASLLSS